MNDYNFIEQIYRNLDRELSTQEQAELSLYLSEHPDAARIEKQCIAVHEQLAASQNSSVEPDLKSDIMNKIDKQKYAHQSDTPEVRIVRHFWQQPAFRFAFTLAAGIFIGVFLFSLVKADFKPTLFDNKEMKGTLSNSGAPADWITGDILNFRGWEVKATIRPRYSASVVEIYLDLSSGDVIETTLDYNSDDFDIMAVVPQQTDANTSFSTAVNQVRILSSGDNKIGIKLANKNNQQHEISIKINQRSNQLYQNTLIVNKQ